MTSLAPTSRPELETFEDRVLFELVDLTGDRPLPLGEYISERALAERLPDLLGLSVDEVRSDAFFNSKARLELLAATSELEVYGLIQNLGTMGSDSFRPTSSGRDRVRRWRDEHAKREGARVAEARRRLLEAVADGSGEALEIRRLATAAGITLDAWDAALGNLLDEGLIERTDNNGPRLKGKYRVTQTGNEAIQLQRPRPPIHELRQLREEIEAARRGLELEHLHPETLIRDDELQARCSDLLAAADHYDRAVREATVVLEARVRKFAAATSETVGVDLMNRAFGRQGPLQLSPVAPEQVGAMQMYAGLMAFYRNPVGHHLIATERDDAIRVVVWIDHLLHLLTAWQNGLGSNSGPPQAGGP